MSSISSRPRVQKINGPVLTSLAAAGVVLAAKAIQAVLATSQDSTKRMKQTPPPEQGLEPAAILREQFQQHRRAILKQAQTKLPEVEALRAATLATVVSTPFYIDNPAVIHEQCQALQAATTVTQVHKAERALLDSLAAGHQQVFVNTLALACRRAAARMGFDRVEVVRLPQEVRVIAADAAGRTLVSEIRVDAADREPAMATEVVGVLDGSCQQLLDEFDRSLEAEGVRSAPPSRKFTGGVCELETARAIARERWKPLANPHTAARPRQQDAHSRTQRLNTLPTLSVRTKE